MAKAKVPVNKRPARAVKTAEPVVAKVEVKEVKFNGRYIRLADNEHSDKFREMGERVFRKEIKWAYFAMEGNTGYHYYKLLISKSDVKK